MRTSGTFRRTDPLRRGAARQAGFTLLEMIVVLAIMGLVAAVAAPAAVRGIETWRRQAQLDLLAGQIRGLPARARASGRPIDIDDATLGAEGAPLALEPGWTLAVPEPWRVQANGACPDAVVEVHGPARVQVIHVEAPFCEARPGEVR